MNLPRELGVPQTTALYLPHRFRESFEECQIFSGIVEADDFYFGGLEKNKHWDFELNEVCDTVCKTAVAGLKDRDSNQVIAKIIDNTRHKALHGLINDNVEEESAVCTDNFKSYQNMQGYDHQFVKHNVGEYVDANIRINGKELFWRVLNCTYNCTFHKLSHKHIERYVTEFVGLQNTRVSTPLN